MAKIKPPSCGEYPPVYKSATNRMVGPARDGVIGIAFDTDNEVIHLKLSVDDALQVCKLIQSHCAAPNGMPDFEVVNCPKGGVALSSGWSLTTGPDDPPEDPSLPQCGGPYRRQKVSRSASHKEPPPTRRQSKTS